MQPTNCTIGMQYKLASGNSLFGVVEESNDGKPFRSCKRTLGVSPNCTPSFPDKNIRSIHPSAPNMASSKKTIIHSLKKSPGSFGRELNIVSYQKRLTLCKIRHAGVRTRRELGDDILVLPSQLSGKKSKDLDGQGVKDDDPAVPPNDLILKTGERVKSLVATSPEIFAKLVPIQADDPDCKIDKANKTTSRRSDASLSCDKGAIQWTSVGPFQTDGREPQSKSCLPQMKFAVKERSSSNSFTKTSSTPASHSSDCVTNPSCSASIGSPENGNDTTGSSKRGKPRPNSHGRLIKIPGKLFTIKRRSQDWLVRENAETGHNERGVMEMVFFDLIE